MSDIAPPLESADLIDGAADDLVNLLGGVEAVAELQRDHVVSAAVVDNADPDDLAALDAITDDDEEELDEVEPEQIEPPAAAEVPAPDPGEGGDPPSAPSPGTDLGQLAIDLYRDRFGTDPTPEALVEAIQIVGDIRQLTPQQLQAVAAAIQQPNPQPLAPTQPLPQPAPMQPHPNMPPAAGFPAPSAGVPQGPVAAPVPGVALPDYVEPEVKAAFEAQQAELARQQAIIDQIAQAQQQQNYLTAEQQLRVQQEEMNAATLRAEERFMESNPGLTPADIARIRRKAGDMGSAFPAYLAASGGDQATAVYSLLEASFVALPDIHSRVNQARVQQAVDVALADEKRKAKAGAVAGGASAAPRKQRGALTDKQNMDGALAELRQLDSDGFRFE